MPFPKIIPFVLAATVSLAAVTAEPIPDPTELLTKVDQRRFVPDMDFTLTLTAYKDSQVVEESALWGWVKADPQGTKALLAFVEPASTKGRKMLMDGPTVYLLFPKTRNPIRLSPLQVLVGQSSNGDVARASFSQDYDAQGLTSEEREGKPCWVFALAAKADRQGSAYRKVSLWVEKETLRPVAADFFGTGEQKLKHATYGDFRTVGDKTVAFRLDIGDGADPAKHTVLQYGKVGRQALPNGAFRRDYLEGWTPEMPQ